MLNQILPVAVDVMASMSSLPSFRPSLPDSASNLGSPTDFDTQQKTAAASTEYEGWQTSFLAKELDHNLVENNYVHMSL